MTLVRQMFVRQRQQYTPRVRTSAAPINVNGHGVIVTTPDNTENRNMYGTLIEPLTLQSLLSAERCVVLDCRFDLAKPQAGELAFLAGHIAGAQYAHLDRDLSGTVTPSSGRHPLPDVAKFSARVGAWGIDNQTQVVAYDQNNGMFAAHLWWLLCWLGHTRVAVLNGGVHAWQKAGLRLSSEIAPRSARLFVPSVQAHEVVAVAEIEHAVRDANLGASGTARLIDARAADRFAGRNETIDPVAGHIPSAGNFPFAQNLDAEGRFQSPDALRALWAPILGTLAAPEMIMMCGSGVSACHNLLALEHAGLRGARLYAGSWSEWIRDASRPIATGEC